jgi:endonuclease G
LVAVIGHPALDQRDRRFDDIDRVFGGAPMKVKRLMPGRISNSTPYVEDLLVHDCSTLGGVSGGCLIDLGFSHAPSPSTLGQVIGIHMKGTRMDENRAFPA